MGRPPIECNLEIMTAILAAVVCAGILLWDGLTLSGRALIGFMVLYTLHEWEESRFPGGFYDLFFGGFGVDIDVSEGRMHLPVAVYLLIMLLVPFALQDVTFLVLVPLGLGLFEGIIHVAGIRIHRLERPYTPGMVTGIALFAYSVLVISAIVGAGGLPAWQWVAGFALSFIGFAVMERFFLGTVGLTFMEFRRMAMARVLGGGRR
ncbi:MAG: HXXEE domain-containing protein [Candidatus Methanomethylophilaceae archaeon]|nr:HXXEE domain-containing protein [Candidatus Methanomethylophilaceae archaeon]